MLNEKVELSAISITNVSEANVLDAVYWKAFITKHQKDEIKAGLVARAHLQNNKANPMYFQDMLLIGKEGKTIGIFLLDVNDNNKLVCYISKEQKGNIGESDLIKEINKYINVSKCRFEILYI
ncbi:MAG: hypothetical protein BGN88_09770 [Clostridiales bacterium 43-6]|nr:MAG: hypothetical protein BGN88_09770 [Clostridiales bacterium 43-6]